MKHIVSIEWLKANLFASDLVIADCRFQLGHVDAGRQAYGESHIPGAVYFDLERDLSAPIGEHGGRHPLPDLEPLALKLGLAGISKDTRIVAYDDQGGAMASRFWWLLKYLGHEDVFVLDEGFSAWKREGQPVDALQETPIPATFIANPQSDLLVDVAEVRAKLGQPGTILLDSREAPRYLGEAEPIDKAAGHIPGAINKFWKGVLDEQGRVKTDDELIANYAELPRDKEIIVYCGSGVTATPNVLGLSEAGFTNVKLYAGSWSDWISYGENPVATGRE
ncbi:sulfurtransferase [Paenibacillus psychroresistens]|uniref:Sulfurtransferase n=1 Tax=Paenibacillus psychroresistens TaxID=1778678 RepID=A0A6B8RUM1_9BACL|nr:sulfurtransferase [Paenibacillus psychroresistens]QGQ99315.1 sulfurtransferase [Paenibacillus psychroresistens]